MCRCRGSLGTTHLYRLSDVMLVAQRKHGSVEGMQAAKRERAGKAQQIKSNKKQAVEGRTQQLKTALARVGGKLT